MDTIWDRNPSKSDFIGCCGWDDKKQMTTQNQLKSNTKKKRKEEKAHTQIKGSLCFIHNI